MTKEDVTINREASDKSKGFRLQKLRMIQLILDELENQNNVLVFGAVEFFEDVFIHKGSSDTSETSLEEDKNYNPSSSFTINHPIVLNTLVSFIDLWLFKIELDPNARFVFYSTNRIGKERETEFSKSKNLILPSEPVLELLQKNKLSTNGLLDIVKANLLNEYESQYNAKNPRRIIGLENLKDEDWMNFLNQIDWNFNQLDDKDLKSSILEQIKKSRLFNSNLKAKEEVIFNELIELVDERQNCNSFSDRLLNCADVKNAFLKAELDKTVAKTEDFVWKQWAKLTPPETRNLIEKIQSVSKNYSQKGIRIKNLKASRGLLSTKEYEKDKKFLSIRYRIYEACLVKLDEYDISNKSTEVEINSIFNQLIDYATAEIDKLKVNYNYYNICKADIIEGVVYELFESCYLAFD